MCLGIYVVIDEIINYEFFNEDYQKTITLSKILVEEAAYGEASEETKQEPYYNYLQNELEEKVMWLKENIEAGDLEKALKHALAREQIIQYNLILSSNRLNITYHVGQLLIWSLFISSVVFFALEVKYTNIKKYLLVNLLMLVIGTIACLLTNSIQYYSFGFGVGDVLPDFYDVLPFILIYIVGLFTNIKRNMNASFRMNIIYAVFAILVGIIFDFAIEIYLILAFIDVIYNSIKLRKKEQA